MIYEKQNFQDKTVLKAEHLNKIEDGIVDLAQSLAQGETFQVLPVLNTETGVLSFSLVSITTA